MGFDLSRISDYPTVIALYPKYKRCWYTGLRSNCISGDRAYFYRYMRLETGVILSLMWSQDCLMVKVLGNIDSVNML